MQKAQADFRILQQGSPPVGTHINVCNLGHHNPTFQVPKASLYVLKCPLYLCTEQPGTGEIQHGRSIMDPVASLYGGHP